VPENIETAEQLVSHALLCACNQVAFAHQDRQPLPEPVIL